MKIGQPSDKPATTGVNIAPAKAAPVKPEAPISLAPTTVGTAAAPSATLESSAKVALSTTAASLISNQKTANADFDADKVDRVSKALDDGSYRVNADVIADKLISNAQELLSQVTR